MTDEKRPETRFFIIHESVAESWLKDAGTLAMFLGLIGIGWLIDSSAMQWSGAIIGFIFIIATAKMENKVHYHSIDAARAEFDRIEAKLKGRTV